MDEKKLKAHILLLDDKDELVFTSVRDSLINQKADILEHLEKAWEESNNKLVQKRLEEIISQIQTKIIKRQFSKWIKTGGNDLIEGANIICKQKYFESEFSDVIEIVEKIKNNAWLEMHNNLTDQHLQYVHFQTHKMYAHLIKYHHLFLLIF
jgi:repressor of nif and glnA expression